MIRAIRPVAAPFLNRFQLRIQQAVNDLDLMPRLERVEEHVRENSKRLEALNGVLEVQLMSLQLGVDSIRLDQVAEQRNNVGLAERLMQLESMVTELRHEIGLRQDAATRALGQQVRDGVSEVVGMLGARTDTIIGRVAIPIGKDIMVRTPDGYVLLPAEDFALIAAAYESAGRLEPGTVAVIQGLLREGDTVLDVGANVGLTVLPAARCVGAAGKVIAVEASSRVCSLLKQTLLLNGLDGQVSVHHCAAGEAAGSASLNLAKISGHSSLLALPSAERTEEVEVRPLDDLVPAGTKVHFAKLDVEGYEPQAWRGMQRIVAENPQIALLVEFGPEHLRRAAITPELWIEQFVGAGFAVFEVEEQTGLVKPARSADELAQVFSVNLLMLRQPPSAYPELRMVTA